VLEKRTSREDGSQVVIVIDSDSFRSSSQLYIKREKERKGDHPLGGDHPQLCPVELSIQRGDISSAAYSTYPQTSCEVWA
jgi:hypothetical protein